MTIALSALAIAVIPGLTREPWIAGLARNDNCVARNDNQVARNDNCVARNDNPVGAER